MPHSDSDHMRPSERHSLILFRLFSHFLLLSLSIWKQMTSEWQNSEKTFNFFAQNKRCSLTPFEGFRCQSGRHFNLGVEKCKRHYLSGQVLLFCAYPKRLIYPVFDFIFILLQVDICVSFNAELFTVNI